MLSKHGRLILKGLNQRRAKVQEDHLKPPTEIHSHPKVPCRERAAGRQGAIMWRGCGEEESGGQEHDGRQMPFVGGEAGSEAVARKLDEKDEKNEVTAKWKEVKQIRKTDAEESEATTRRSVGKPLETPTEDHSHPKVPCRERAVRRRRCWKGQSQQFQRGSGENLVNSSLTL